MAKITLMPYGAMIYGGEKFNRKEGIVIALAGPICNGVLALATFALWWLLPESYVYTQDFLNSNLTLMCFNLLPCFPLDGSRIVLSLCKDKIKALKILKIVGIILSLIIIGQESGRIGKLLERRLWTASCCWKSAREKKEWTE